MLNVSITVTKRRGQAAVWSKANKEARLTERKVCFISNVSMVGRGGGAPIPKANFSHTNNLWARAFIDGGRGVKGYMQKLYSQF